MNRQEIIDRLYASLSKLGSTPDSVAQELEIMGIQGECHTHDSCPIVKFLVSEGFGFASVTGSYAWVSPTNNFVDDEECVPIHLETHVKRFIRNFDQGFYPNLVLK